MRYENGLVILIFSEGSDVGQLVDSEEFGEDSTDGTSGMGQEEKDQFIAHTKRMGVVSRILSNISDEKAAKVTRLVSEVADRMHLSEVDIEQVTMALNIAHLQRKISGGSGSIVPYLALVGATRESSQAEELDNSFIPSIADAPRNSFGGVPTHGDPYVFLMKNYGSWLQPGRKCLDRPTLLEYDRKLLKALQQKYTRDNNSMPPLSDIFPGKREARENRTKFMSGKNAS